MEEGDKPGMDITDKTDSKVLAVRRTIYLTIMSRSDDCSNYGKSVKFNYVFCTAWILKSALTSC